MIGRDFNNSLNTLTYLQFVKLGADAAKTHLAEIFGSGTNFNARGFCDWYQLNVIGNECWYRSLPSKDQLKVLKLWNESLSPQLPQTDITQQKISHFLPEFTIAKANVAQPMVQKSPSEYTANSSISKKYHKI